MPGKVARTCMTKLKLDKEVGGGGLLHIAFVHEHVVAYATKDVIANMLTRLSTIVIRCSIAYLITYVTA